MNRSIVSAFAIAVYGCSPGAVKPAETTDGGETSQDAATDASTNDTSVPDTGSPVDAGTGADAACNPATAWPAMLAAPIVPLQNAANLNLNQEGAGVVYLGYAEMVNCAPTPSSGVGISTLPGWPQQTYGTWGSAQQVTVAWDSDTADVTQLILGTGYTGAIAFSSRMGGAYGRHTYTLGIGQLVRDGVTMPIDWTGAAPFDEIFDGLLATFATPATTAQACDQSGACSWGYTAPSGSEDAGQDAYSFTVGPIDLLVGFEAVGQGGQPQLITIALPNGLPLGTDAGP
jgi:hypothetical protein